MLVFFSEIALEVGDSCEYMRIYYMMWENAHTTGVR